MGLNKEEIQSARWIAVAKRDNPELDFLKILLEVTETKQKKEKKTMEEKTAKEKKREEEFILDCATLGLAGSRITSEVIRLTERGKIKWNRKMEEPDYIYYYAQIRTRFIKKLFIYTNELCDSIIC